MKRAGRVLIGTSGWTYGDWRKRFYPEGLPQSKWLSHYAQHFSAVEVNGSFYRVPKVETVARWSEQVPTRFRFAVKLWKGITHFRRLRVDAAMLTRFFDAFAPLRSRQWGPLLVQLPPQMGPDRDRLARFLGILRDVVPRRLEVVLEVRHDAWLSDETYSLLERERVALCVHDMQGKGATKIPTDVSFVYVRRHGPSGDYRQGYTHRKIADDAQRVTAWGAQGKTVYVFYNNDLGGHAIRDAKRLLARVPMSAPTPAGQRVLVVGGANARTPT